MQKLPVLNSGGRDGAVGVEERERIAAGLKALSAGEVRFDRHNAMLYATDASIYQVEPLGVIIPRSVDDIARIVAHCATNGIALLPRGGGTSLAGQCTNRAVVLDYSPSCRRALALDVTEGSCQVEPGITVDELNRWLESRQSGLFYAPDPATAAQASIGGCIGNNAAGARSIRYGRTSENVARLDVVLGSGERTWLGRGAGRESAVALQVAERVAEVVQRYAALIRERYPKTLRRNAGYALDLVLAQLDRGTEIADLDLTGLMCGSEGTLGLVVGAKLKLHPVARSKGLAIVSFESVAAAIAAVAPAVATGAAAVELLDDVVLDAARGNNECRRYLPLVPKINGADPAAILYVEYQEAGSMREVEARFDHLKRTLCDRAMACYTDKPSLDRLWALRKAGEPLLHGLAGHRKPVTCVEDNAVPLENLERFVEGFRQIVARQGTTAAYYAHASVGVLHVRPLLDLHDEADRERMRAIAVEVADLARACGGVMSGEHGDGRIRGPLLERFFGPELMGAMREVKSIFDPRGILNPGMIIEMGPAERITENLRVNPGGRKLTFPDGETYFEYVDQEDFGGALEMCNGAGVCRKTAGGTMCPSYRVTLDERHTTRGRGNALRLAISGQLKANGQPGTPAWDDPETMETLRLCLSCKACKSECPSNVDIARLKAEYTAQRYKRHGGAPLGARLMGHIRVLNRLGSVAPGVSNALAAWRPVRWVLNRLLNLAPQRSLPKLGGSAYRWFARRRQSPPRAGAAKVVLYVDCFSGYNEVGIAQAAVVVLESLGYEVVLPKVGCCGRAMVSTGLLGEAVRSADAALTALRPHLDDPSVKAIVFCEPSCLAAVKDEWLQLKLKADRATRKRMALRAMLVEEFVERAWEEHPKRPALRAQGPGSAVLMHGHCHQKSLFGEETSAALLRRLVGGRLRVIPSGCCGMAGSFGFMKDRYAVSMAIGEQTVFTPVREAGPDALIVAPGASCRHQIADGTGRRALHPIELAAKLMAPGNDQAPADFR